MTYNGATITDLMQLQHLTHMTRLTYSYIRKISVKYSVMINIEPL